jgi:hypothetical protein
MHSAAEVAPWKREAKAEWIAIWARSGCSRD